MSQTLRTGELRETIVQLKSLPRQIAFVQVRHRRLPRMAIETLEPRRLMAAGASVSPEIPHSLTVEVARTSDPDNNGVVVKSQTNLIAVTTPGAVVRLDRNADGSFERAARADASGRAVFKVILPVGQTPFRVKTSGESDTAIADLTVTRGDAVVAWNATLLNAIRTDATGPPQAARAMAMVQLAVYDAVNSVVGTNDPYHFQGRARPGTSATAAASQAAHRVLTELFPKQASIFDATLQESLATVRSELGLKRGVRLGNAVGTDMLNLRVNDGSAATVAYAPGTDPGDWVPTPPRYLAGLAPQWPNVTPFVMTSGDQFRPGPPPSLTSTEYAAAFNEVKLLGSAISTTRTAEQTTLSEFWSDVPGSTFTPPGHWNQIAQKASLSRGLGLLRNARLFAVLDAALADAAICCWDAKYHYDLWRPITAIREADIDDNPETLSDPTWTPLWTTPNFSSYTSGHSTFSGAAQVVLESFFGKNFAFTDSGDPTLGLTKREFTNFRQASEEAGLSRVLGGIHFSFDNKMGLQGGREVGRFVVERVAR